MAMAARRAAYKWQKADTQDSQLKRPVQRPNTHASRACNAAYARFPETHAQGLEEEFRQRDQMGLFQRLKSLSMEDTRKASSQYIRDEGKMMLRDPGLILGRWARFFGVLLNANSDKLRPKIVAGLPQRPVTHALGVEPTEIEVTAALRSIANAKTEGQGESPSGTTQTRSEP